MLFIRAEIMTHAGKNKSEMPNPPSVEPLQHNSLNQSHRFHGNTWLRVPLLHPTVNFEHIYRKIICLSGCLQVYNSKISRPWTKFLNSTQCHEEFYDLLLYVFILLSGTWGNIGMPESNPSGAEGGWRGGGRISKWCTWDLHLEERGYSVNCVNRWKSFQVLKGRLEW